MEITRNEDGTLVVPVKHARVHTSDAEDESSSETPQSEAPPGTRLVHPGEGGYDEALAEWDLQQNPDREPVVSTASGRREAMTLVHQVGLSSDHSVAVAVRRSRDPNGGR